jgi:hypothetical protein
LQAREAVKDTLNTLDCFSRKLQRQLNSAFHGLTALQVTKTAIPFHIR